MSAAGPWQVDLAIPDGLGDLGLHREENGAAARFREQLVEALGQERAAEVGPDAEREFRRARALHAGKPVLWSGFLLLASHAAAGIDLTLDPADLPADAAEAERVRELAQVKDALLLTLTVGVAPIGVPSSGPLTPAALVSRTLKAQYGEDITVHLVSYGDRRGVASVRVLDPAEEAPAEKVPPEGAPSGDAPAIGSMVLAEVRLPFAEDGAMVTVTAATPQAGAIDRAVLLAGSVARTVRLRSTEGGRGGDVAPRDDEPPARGERPSAGEEPVPDDAPAPDPEVPTLDGTAAAPRPLAVVLPDETRLPDGLSLLGRDPRRTERLPAEHTVTVPDPSVSRTHLALRVDGGVVTATDLHSTNGTVVRRRGEVLRLVAGETTELRDGDHIGLGAAVLRVTSR